MKEFLCQSVNVQMWEFLLLAICFVFALMATFK